MIRGAVPADQPVLRDIFARASLSNAGDRDALAAHPGALDFDWPDGSRARCQAVVDTAGTVVGFVTTTRAGDHLEIADLFVDPDRMRQGHARSLLDDVVAHAREVGASRLEVDANPHARDFYEATGFAVTGTVTTEFGPGLRMARPV